MPPGIKHPNYVCWDDLETPIRAMLIGYYQTTEHDDLEKAKVGLASKVM